MRTLRDVEVERRPAVEERQRERGAEADVLEREHADRHRRQREREARADARCGDRSRLGPLPKRSGGIALAQLLDELEIARELERVARVELHRHVWLRAASRDESELREADLTTDSSSVTRKLLSVPLNERLSPRPRRARPTASKVSGFSIRPWTIELGRAAVVFLNDAMLLGAGAAAAMSRTFGFPVERRDEELAAAGCPSTRVCSVGAPLPSRVHAAVEEVEGSEQLRRARGEEALRDRTCRRSRRRPCRPAAPPCPSAPRRPMLGVAKPPAWSLENVTPSVAGRHGRERVVGRLVASSLTTSANTAVPASRPRSTKPGYRRIVVGASEPSSCCTCGTLTSAFSSRGRLVRAART